MSARAPDAGGAPPAGGRSTRSAPPISRRRTLAGAAAAAILGGCAHGVQQATRSMVQGRVAFSPPELPAGAILEVTLEDTARADAPSVRVASVRSVDPRPGIEYSLAFDPTAVPASARLSVRARITAGGRLLHTTDRHHPVQPGTASTRVDLSLLHVSAGP